MREAGFRRKASAMCRAAAGVQPVARGGHRAEPAAKVAAGPLGQGTGVLAAEVGQGAEQVKGEARRPPGAIGHLRGEPDGKGQLRRMRPQGLPDRLIVVDVEVRSRPLRRV